MKKKQGRPKKTIPEETKAKAKEMVKAQVRYSHICKTLNISSYLLKKIRTE